MEVNLAIIGLAAPITVAVVQALKSAGLPSRFAPLVSLASGLAAGVLLAAAGLGDDVTYGAAAVAGLIAGATAAGLWSGTKAVLAS